MIYDFVLVKISPLKDIMKFEKKAKSRYIGPFEVLKMIGIVAYRVVLLPALSSIHNVFHVSMLRKYVQDPLHVIIMNVLHFGKI